MRNYETFWKLSKIPDEELFREAGRRRAALRINPGRTKVLRPCEWCGLEFGGREIQQHVPRCPAKQKVAV